MALHIPEIAPDDATLTAAFRYAAAGFYVLPVKAGSKNPGSVVGGSWHHQSSRDPEMLASWFAGTDHGIALHAGRSGAVILDVDRPGRMPPVLAAAITDYEPPFQSTRVDEPGRGHYVFASPPGRVLGNGTGKLGGGWGEIRGLNGVIIAAPSAHGSPGGRYVWQHTGSVPVLPGTVADLLHDSSTATDAATDAEVAAFLREHTGASRPALLDGWCTTFATKVAEGESRHQRMVSVAAGALCEARAGYYPASAAEERLGRAFVDAVCRPPAPGGQQGPARGPGMAVSEWAGILAWAVAQANAADLDEVQERLAEKMPDGDDLSWIPNDPPPRADPVTGEILDGPAAAPVTSPSMFFDKHEGLLSLQLAKAVVNKGPIASDHGQALYRYVNGVWRPDGERAVKERVVELLGDRYRMSSAATAIDMLSSREPLITEDNIDTSLINLPNGLLDWRTEELHPHDPKIPSTIQLPIEWNPGAHCPRIKEWMTEVFPPDSHAFVEEVVGYALLNDNPLHKAILLFGRGRNGKGSFLRLLKALIGKWNISSVTPQSLDDNRFRVAELHGKLANLVGDVDPRIFKATEIFKQVTGGDVITAEYKFGQPFQFYCRALMIAGFNALPRSSDTSEGFFSRWIVLPFIGYFPAGVADSAKEMRMHETNELQGLLVLAVRGLKRLMDRRAFELPPSVVEETAGFRRTADPVRAFLDEYLPGEPVGWIPRTECYRRYSDWAVTNGYSPVGAATFYERVEACANDLARHTITTSKRQGTRGYKLVEKAPAGGNAGGRQGAGGAGRGQERGRQILEESPVQTVQGAEGAGFSNPTHARTEHIDGDLCRDRNESEKPAPSAPPAPSPHLTRGFPDQTRGQAPAPSCPPLPPQPQVETFQTGSPGGHTQCVCGWGLGSDGCQCSEEGAR